VCGWGKAYIRWQCVAVSFITAIRPLMHGIDDVDDDDDDE